MNGPAYYNDSDEFCCDCLRGFVAAGLIAPGDVDGRDIRDVQASDLRGYSQHHFFAGLGGWSFALRLAGFPDERPVWSGSCPCQPFSAVGRRRGFRDARDHWPEWRRLIREYKPELIFGEQVDTATVWLDRVFSDLEASGYACGAADLPAASVGARHIRQRLWFVADADQARWADPERVAAAEAQTNLRKAAGMGYCVPSFDFRRTAELDPSWVVDGLSGEGLAVGAYGNSIVPQVAAEFIAACMTLPPSSPHKERPE